MNIKEVETRSGMARANIRYYEQEGLLCPARLENGYRDYSEEDLNTLARIRLLRQLGVPLERIRDLQSGAASLPQVAAAQAETLAAGAQAAQAAIEICRAICDDGAEYATLDAALYENGPRRIPEQKAADPWEGAEGRESKTEWQDLERPVYIGARAVKETAPGLPPVRDPMRRCGAIVFDVVLRFFVLTAAVCALTWAGLPWLQAGALRRDALVVLLLAAAAWLSGFIAEPLLLHWFGTTPGKAVFGLSIRCADGSLPSFQQAAERTWGRAWSWGLATSWWGGAPELRRIWQEAESGTPNDWQIPGEVYAQKDEQPWREAAWGVGIVLMLGLSILWLGDTVELPRRRGALTAAQFAANYNGYGEEDGVHAVSGHSWYELRPDGSWAIKDGYQLTDGGVLYSQEGSYTVYYSIPEDAVLPGPLTLVEADGTLTAVYWQTTGEGVLECYRQLAVMRELAWSFAAAQRGLHFWNLRPLDRLEGMTPYYGDVTFTLGRVTVQAKVEPFGPASAAEQDEYEEYEQKYRLTLTMEKQP